MKFKPREVYEGKSILDRCWREAYSLHMPKNLLWYENEMEKISKKINFFIAMRSLVKRPTERRELDSRIESLRRKHAVFVKAHNKALNLEYKKINGKGVAK